MTKNKISKLTYATGKRADIFRGIFLTAAVVAAIFRIGTTAASAETNDSTHGYATVNGLNMYYEIHGPANAENPPLVLLHGGGSTIDTTFGNVLQSFAKSRHVIAVEQQGHGRTADIDRPLTFEQMADDTAALLRHLKIERADFFGFSNGGNVAMQIAIRHPEMVRKLIVASAFFKRDGIYPEVWESLKQATSQNMPAVLRDEYIKVAPDPENLSTLVAKLMKNMLGFRDWRPEDIQSINAPTIVMIGDADVVRPEHAVEMFRLLPHSQLAVFPGSGHGTFLGEAGAVEGGGNRFNPNLVVLMVETFLDAPMPKERSQ